MFLAVAINRWACDLILCSLRLGFSISHPRNQELETAHESLKTLQAFITYDTAAQIILTVLLNSAEYINI